jgi:Helix-turn-helix family
MPRDPALARQLWRRIEPIHAVTYFSPEPIGALRDAGYKGFWMGYFAGRAAPLGAVGPEVVTALFYNFAPAHVGRAIPDAWSFAPPDTALDARYRGSVAALRRAIDAAGVDGDAVATAAGHARVAAESAPPDGRALFAGNSGLPWPDDPVGVLWHATTRLREHRGDGHVAALTAAGISGREANVLQAAAGHVSKDILFVARHYDDAEWDGHVASLVERGLVGEDGGLTAAGTELKDEIEERTDRAALTAYTALDDGSLDELREALLPLARAVVATGDMPPTTPIGFRFDE